MSFNGTMDDFIAAVRRDPALVEIVRDLQTHRYAAPAKFEALLWLALANSMCIGARDVLREMNPPEPKTPA